MLRWLLWLFVETYWLKKNLANFNMSVGKNTTIISRWLFIVLYSKRNIVLKTILKSRIQSDLIMNFFNFELWLNSILKEFDTEEKNAHLLSLFSFGNCCYTDRHNSQHHNLYEYAVCYPWKMDIFIQHSYPTSVVRSSALIRCSQRALWYEFSLCIKAANKSNLVISGCWLISLRVLWCNRPTFCHLMASFYYCCVSCMYNWNCNSRFYQRLLEKKNVSFIYLLQWYNVYMYALHVSTYRITTYNIT